MDCIVQKFGGTSLGTGERLLKVAHIIKDTAEDKKVVAVVSAMSSYVKTQGTTNKLAMAAQAAINNGAYIKLTNELEEAHLNALATAVTLEKERGWAREIVVQEFKRLRSFLDAIRVIGEITHRSEDVIISVGEKLSACILSATLNSIGIDAKFVNLEDLTQEQFTEVNPTFFAHLRECLVARIQACGTKIPVVTGFFGMSPGGIIHSIGRGYTDFTAALIAAGVKANELQIWKEVDGIFSADPRIVEGARILPSVFPEEAAELTYYGSEVIHPFTMEQVISKDIPIRIKNTFHPEKPGTLIVPNGENNIDINRKPIAVTCKRGVIVLNIHSNRMLLAHGFMARIFNILEKHRIIIDLISTSEVNVSLTFDGKTPIAKAMPELQALGRVTKKTNMAILSLVGRHMRHNVGVAGGMFSALAKSSINIEMISQGSSEINISCVIADEHAIKALKATHERMLDEH